jgi:hypothetical protein
MTAHEQRKMLAAREPQKFELAIDIETAKTLGTMISPEFLFLPAR